MITRGAGKQILFEEPGDYRKYLSVLKEYKKEFSVDLLAYCLMSNHVHLLLKDKKKNLSWFMKSVGISYSAYYNKHFEHAGHVFQDRFRSEKVEDEIYLRNVYRYILLNPEKAHIAPADRYTWSSYWDYVHGGGLTSTKELRELIGDEDAFARFLLDDEDIKCVEFEYGKSSEEWMAGVVHRLLDGKSGVTVKSYERSKRNRVLREMKKAGLSLRQIARVTGISHSVIRNA